MKQKKSLVSIVLGVALFVGISSCENVQKEIADDQVETASLNEENIILHGKYLVDVMGCNDCHSPKRMGPNGPETIKELFLSGYPSDRPIIDFDSPLLKEGFGIFYPDLTAAAGPWGISFAANLTPDETGIGNWTEAQFKVALRQGKYKGLEGSRNMLPPMPWYNYGKMTDEDIHAVYEYLQSIDPVENLVPAAVSPMNM